MYNLKILFHPFAVSLFEYDEITPPPAQPPPKKLASSCYDKEIMTTKLLITNKI